MNGITNGASTPFAGSPLNSPYAQRGTGKLPTIAETSATPSGILDAFGVVIPSTVDPAWQPPRDPLTVGDPRVRAAVINREIPLVTTQTGWGVAEVRRAIENLVAGLFDWPSQLMDAILGDSRVQSAMGSRTGGLLGRPVRFKLPPKYKNDDRAKRCLDEWQRHWPTMASEPALSALQTSAVMLGFGLAQITWDTTGDVWLPYLGPWHSRYSYYHWIFRRFVAITQDGQVPLEPGDGHWIVHAPHGQYRGWMRGAARAIAPWWLARNYALRDWARYSERHGMPILLAETPFGADPAQIQNYRAQLAQLGQESVVQLPSSSDPNFGKYGLDFLEASDNSWEGFQRLIEQCNAEITLSLLGQNLTSEVKEGSFAAARVHADVRQAILEADARALSQTIYTQIARPFAAINFGDPEIAPRAEWDVAPYEDEAQQAKTFQSFAAAIWEMRHAGYKINNVEELARDFGLRLGLAEIEHVLPVVTGLGAAHGGGPDLTLTPSDQAAIVTVNEARASEGLPPIAGGELTIAEYKAKHASIIATAAAADDGIDDDDDDGGSSDGDEEVAQDPEPDARVRRLRFSAADRVGLMACQDGIRAGRGYYVWQSSATACDDCADLDGETYDAYGDVPDAHPNCECTLEYVAYKSASKKKKLPKKAKKKLRPTHAKKRKAA